MAIPVLSPELMESQLERYKKRLANEKNSDARIALTGRIQAIELFLDNCVMETLSGSMSELKIDTNLFDIPFLAKALGIGTEALPKQLALDWNKPAEKEIEDAVIIKEHDDPYKIFKDALLNGLEVGIIDPTSGKVCPFSKEKRPNFSLPVSYYVIIDPKNEEPVVVTEVEKEVILKTEEKIVKGFLNHIRKSWKTMGSFTNTFGHHIDRLIDMSKLVNVPRAAVYDAIIKEIGTDIPAHDEFINGLKAKIEEEHHLLGAFLMAKRLLPNWSDEELSTFIRKITETMERGEELITPSKQSISRILPNSDLRTAFAAIYPEVSTFLYNKQTGDAYEEFHSLAFDEKNPKQNFRGWSIKVSQLYDMISPVRAQELSKRRKYVEKGYPV